MFFSPLEQFEVNIISPCSFIGTLFTVTNLNMFLILSVLTIFLISFICLFNADVYSNSYLSMFEGVFDFVLTIVKQQAGRNGLLFFPIFLWVFLFIAVNNFIGLFPLCFTATSHIIVTLTLALGFNISFLLYGFFLHGFAFLKLFVPNGAPAALLPLIVVIEVVSYLIRSFSLALRLFANLMAGHTLLHILMGFVISAASLSFFIALVPYVIVLAVGLLEMVIAVLQAYVFVVLLSIYLGDSLSPGH